MSRELDNDLEASTVSMAFSHTLTNVSRHLLCSHMVKDQTGVCSYQFLNEALVCLKIDTKHKIIELKLSSVAVSI